MTVMAWIAGVSVLVVFSTFLSSVIYRSGHISARVEELEKWRLNMRVDMHEISTQMTEVVTEIKGLHTLIEERTSPRWSARDLDRRTPASP